MRRTYRWDKNTSKMVEIRRDLCEIASVPMITPDIQPYKSVITGEPITSRQAHREHLRRHGCEEVGNERPNLAPRDTAPPEGEIRNDIREARRQLEWGEAPTMERLRDETPRVMRDLGLGD